MIRLRLSLNVAVLWLVMQCANAVAENGIDRSTSRRRVFVLRYNAPLHTACVSLLDGCNVYPPTFSRSVEIAQLCSQTLQGRRAGAEFGSQLCRLKNSPSELLIDGISASDQDPDSGVELGARALSFCIVADSLRIIRL